VNAKGFHENLLDAKGFHGQIELRNTFITSVCVSVCDMVIFIKSWCSYRLSCNCQPIGSCLGTCHMYASLKLAK
jgi:hypothetical protein